VIVTGGSSGLGRSLLASAPADAVGLVDVSRSGPPSLGREVAHVAADLADPGSWSDVATHLGRLVESREATRVTLFHAAGTLEPIGFAAEVEQEAYRRSVLLNSAAGQVLGAAFLAAVRGRADVRRELVLLSSGAARTSYPGWSAYGAGKAALDHWARTAAAEQEQRGGVRVLSVAPGVVATPMQAHIRATDATDFPPVERFRRLHDDGELEDPDEVADRLWRLLESPPADPVVDLRDHR
jgi:benzil reductase ((S)-benzoin forming)